MAYKIYKTDSRKSTKAYPSKDSFDFFAGVEYTFSKLVESFLEKNNGKGRVIYSKNKDFRFEFNDGNYFELNIISV